MDNAKIFGFAFDKNISSLVLTELNNISLKTYLNDLESIENYISLLINGQPSYILGLGYYSGRDRENLRIETYCDNRFRNDYIARKSIDIQEITPFIRAGDSCKIGKAMGNSYCNYISYKIVTLINSGKLRSQYTFLHLPRGKTSKDFAIIINGLIKKYALA